MRYALLFENEQQCFALFVRPLHQQRNVQLAEPLAEALLQLLLTNRGYARIFRQRLRLGRREKSQGLVWIIQNQVLEILVMKNGGVQTATKKEIVALRRLEATRESEGVFYY